MNCDTEYQSSWVWYIHDTVVVSAAIIYILQI